jgi:hypothetical protein
VIESRVFASEPGLEAVTVLANIVSFCSQSSLVLPARCRCEPAGKTGDALQMLPQRMPCAGVVSTVRVIVLIVQVPVSLPPILSDRPMPMALPMTDRIGPLRLR